MPVDPIKMPDQDDLPPLDELVKQAVTNRTDLAAEKLNATAAINNLGTKNGILPFAIVGGNESQAGISGTGKTVYFDGFGRRAQPIFRGRHRHGAGTGFPARLSLRKFLRRI